MSLNDGYGCFDFFMSHERQIFPLLNDENRLKIWPFLTKLWLFECKCPSKCTSEKTSFKVKEQNSKNYHRNNENEPLQDFKSVFPHVDVKSVLKLFKRYQIAVAMVTKIVG